MSKTFSPGACDSRIHIALAVKDLERSIELYRLLFGREPSKVRPGYAKFEVESPPLNLALNHSSGSTEPGNAIAHFGIQVSSTEAVERARTRLEASGAQIKVEEQTTCCYAVQDKIWVSDPDGNRWEIFVVHADVEQYSCEAAGGACEPGAECCSESESCCT